MGGVVDTVKNVIKDPLGQQANKDAYSAQAGATADANRTLKEMFDISRADMEPWRKEGASALRTLSGEMDDLSRAFTMDDFQASPGYRFTMQEGAKALEGSAAARGGLLSGGTLKGLTQYGQDLASNEFNNAYNRFNADRDQRYNKLASLAGVGQTASQNMASAASNYGQSLSQNQIGLGNAAAASSIAQGNANRALVGQGIQAGMMFCDERLKTNIEVVSKEDLAELKQTLKPYLFKYKDPETFGEGEHVGVMAQDLEKSKLGRTAVKTDKDGNKLIDLKKLLSLLLVTQAEVA